MKSPFAALKALWESRQLKNIQSTTVAGDHNKIEQNFNVYVCEAGEWRSGDFPFQYPPPTASLTQPALQSEGTDKDETEETKRILAYRKLAIEGDSLNALRLLEDLKEDPRYQGAFVALRLEFNIGIIYQSVGEQEKAICSLKVAHAHLPEHPKAKAALAFAYLIEEKYQDAFDGSVSLLKIEGDHTIICSVIALHAATRLKRHISLEDYEFVDLNHADVIAARLEYIYTLHPEDYPDALQSSMEADPQSSRLLSIWALSVLSDVRQNQAFLLGAKMPDNFNDDITNSARVLKEELEQTLRQRPPNKALLLSSANNAAVALRLTGQTAMAARLLDRTLDDHPDLLSNLAEMRAVIFLEQERDAEAFDLIAPLTEHPHLQVMASEIEAKAGNPVNAVMRINAALRLEMPDDLRFRALIVKARIGTYSRDRKTADEAIDDLSAEFKDSHELVLVKSSYSHAFDVEVSTDEDAEEIDNDTQLAKSKELIDSIRNVGSWEFTDIFQTANELFARGFYRQCAELLNGRVSFSRESPALYTLCDACLRGGLGSMAQTLQKNLSADVKDSVFGWKFCANVGYLTGEISKTVSLTRKLFDESPNSLGSLQWYIQSLLRMNDRRRVCRVVKDLRDDKLVGTLAEKQDYVNLLVFCGEIDRARSYAYRLFCTNQNDHRAWMALSSSVLAFGAPTAETVDLRSQTVEIDTAVEIITPAGDSRKYIIEDDAEIFPLRLENISPDHPIASAAWGRGEGDLFQWPLDGAAGNAQITSVKHKALEAFHFVLQRFEEKFPDADGFKSVRFDPTKEDGLEELKAFLRQRAQYGQQKAREYHEGFYPLSFLGKHIGLDPIDAYLGLRHDCGFPVKVSSCLHADQAEAAAALYTAKETGIVCDALAIFLLRRLDITNAVQEVFGKIGVTQSTVDIFARRLEEALNIGSYGEDGQKISTRMAIKGSKIILSEMSELEVNARIDLLRQDLDWLNTSCEIVPAVAKEDPEDWLLRLRDQRGGKFLDDLLACDGSGRVLVSDDQPLRHLGGEFFNIKSAWIQALLFHFEQTRIIPSTKVVTSTILLLEAGEHALSINSHRLLVATEMRIAGEITEAELDLLLAVIGQSGADLPSHASVTIGFINGLWSSDVFAEVRQGLTSIVLRKLVRNLGSDSGIVIDFIQTHLSSKFGRTYVASWRVGHFI